MLSIEENNTILRESIRKLLSIEICLSIEIEGSLYIRELDSGEFAVGGVTARKFEGQKKWEELFESLDSAIDFYIQIRNKEKWGCDYNSFSKN